MHVSTSVSKWRALAPLRAKQEERLLFYRALEVVERKMGREVVINKSTLARALGVNRKSISALLANHRSLARIVSRCQRLYGVGALKHHHRRLYGVNSPYKHKHKH